MGVVRCLDEARDQLNERFPNRDKSSDGSWGDRAHSHRPSSHNGDKSGTPEWRDGDNLDEVRARDFDVDLRDTETGTTMEHVVQEWVRLCREKKMWWVRYIIFNGRIWHKKDGYKTRRYTGANKHNLHAHVNSDFTKKSDSAKNTDWGLKNFRRKAKPKPSPTPAPKPPTAKPVPPVKPTTPPKGRPTPQPQLTVDGTLGEATIRRWQQVMGTPVDGKITENSELVKAVQKHLRTKIDGRLVVDGDGDSLAFGVPRKTIAALQRYLRVPATMRMSAQNSETIMALQRRLNTGTF